MASGKVNYANFKMAKKGGEIGAGEEKGRRRRFYRTLNYRFRETEIPIGRLLVNLQKQKQLSPKGVQFSLRLFQHMANRQGP